ncbi:MAG TPA: c-type cytochrome [Rhodocyclaceae bacterium]|nr:c-type cytochrome [Rhodocyclaceae bacterium]
MFKFSKTLLAAAGLALASSAFAYSGIGRPATEAELKAWDIDVRPDFKGLPKGSGSVQRGQDLWESKCATCHGTFGESNEVFTPLIGGTTKDDQKTGRVASLAKGDVPQRTTFMKVATVSTLFDYIQRAMPWTAPKSLKPDEVYSILAYLLNLAEIVPDDFTLSDANIREVQQRMPNRNGMTTDHGMWPGAPASKGGIGNGGKPDTHNTACMSNCKTEVKVGSTLPDYAEAAHGNLAEQNRMIGQVRGKTPGQFGNAKSDAKTEAKPAETISAGKAATALAQKSGCLACHGVSNKIVGPAFADVAKKYKGQDGALTKLTAKVKAGGQGVWGAIPMPPHAHIKDEDIKFLVTWVLNGAPAN